MRILVLILLAAVSIVVYQYDKEARPTVQPDLDVIVKEWQTEMTVNGVRWEPRWNHIRSVVVKDLPGDSVRGTWFNSTKTLVIDPSLFLRLNAMATIRYTVWHELGHAYGLEHEGDGLLMSEYAIGPLELHEKWPAMKSEYIKVLKQKGYE
jgi:hypothetical protein